jgi:hypothetical protein
LLSPIRATRPTHLSSWFNHRNYYIEKWFLKLEKDVFEK